MSSPEVRAAPEAGSGHLSDVTPGNTYVDINLKYLHNAVLLAVELDGNNGQAS